MINSKFKIPASPTTSLGGQNSKLQYKSQKLRLKSLADTEKLAGRIAANLNGGEVIALTGPLGAGKTTFVQMLAKVLGVKQKVKSPTFTVMNTYNINSKVKSQKSKVQGKIQKLTLCHIDAYRLKRVDELEAIGLDDYLGHPDVITVIEWAEKIKKVVPKNSQWIKFAFNKNERIVLIC